MPGVHPARKRALSNSFRSKNFSAEKIHEIDHFQSQNFSPFFLHISPAIINPIVLLLRRPSSSSKGVFSVRSSRMVLEMLREEVPPKESNHSPTASRQVPMKDSSRQGHTKRGTTVMMARRSPRRTRLPPRAWRRRGVRLISGIITEGVV